MERTETRPPWTPPRVRTVLALLAFFLFACLFDAWSTLIVTGGEPDGEMNPLMRAALAIGPTYFFVLKMTLDLGCGVLLAALARRRRFAWIGFCTLAGIHAALFLFQATLIISVPPPTYDPFPAAASIVAAFLLKRPAP